jgi:hypothetical protein
MLGWLIRQLQADTEPSHAAPRQDVAEAGDLEQALAKAFSFPEGRIRLEECRMEARPVLRLAYQFSGDAQDSEQDRCSDAACSEEEAAGLLRGDDCRRLDDDLPRTKFRFAHFLPDNVPLDDELTDGLGLNDDVGRDVPLGATPADWQRWVDAARQVAQLHCQSLAGGAEFVSASIVWCNYAEGCLVADVEGQPQRVTLPFSGWARQLSHGKLLPEPFVCPLSGAESRQLELSEDGQIVARESLATCEVSGRRVAKEALLACEATGKRALAEFFAKCPVSGQQVLDECRKACCDCHQLVSPNCLDHDRCSACRELVPVSKDDPRMALVLGEHPKLDRWNRWKLSETETTYVLTTTGWLRCLLFVLQKDTLELQYLASAGRFRGTWSEMPRELHSEIIEE